MFRSSPWRPERVVEIKARLGDTVQKGQLLLRVQSADISSAFLGPSQSQGRRRTGPDATGNAPQFLYDKGAISLKDLQVTKNVEK